LYRGISDFKEGYQPRTNIVKDEKGDFVADSHSILARWRDYFSQLLNVHGVNDVKQTEIHTAEPLVTDPTVFEFEMAIEQPATHKWPGIDQIPAELFTVGGRTICSEIHKLINSMSRSLYLFISRAIKRTVVIIEVYHFCQLHTTFYPTTCCQG